MIWRILMTGFALGALLAATAQVQTNAGGQAAGVTGAGIPAAVVRVGGMGAGFGMVGGQAATGRPYSAQQETEHVQTLADGTKITQPTQIVVYYRDSLGRTRTERHMQSVPGLPSSAPAPVFIDVTDPVSGYRYSLDANSHVARRFSFGPARPNGTGGTVGRAVISDAPPPPPPPAAAVSGLTTNSEWFAPAGRLGQKTGNSTTGTASVPQPEFSREALGSKTIEGVLADGTKMTTTYPVGFFGNDRPITTVNETWVSKDLGLTVLTKTSDPRSGDTTMRLTNIVQSEPDASLFQIPADYQVEDIPSSR